MKKKTLKELVEEKRQAYKQSQSSEAEEARTMALPRVFESERRPQMTDVIATVDMKQIAHDSKTDAGVPSHFKLLPEGSSGALYHIVLAAKSMRGVSLGLAVGGDVIIGRKQDADIPLDLDLSPYVTGQHGISRQHALLRPSSSKLYLLDLESTNGTRINGTEVYPSRAVPLRERDVITFGTFSIVVVMLSRRASNHADDA